MAFLARYKWIIVGAAIVIGVIAFLAFRPDKLFVDDAVDESLADAFTTTTIVGPDTTTTSEPTSSETSTTTEGATTTTEVAEPTTTVPAGPVAISTGAFYGIDHSATGTATVYEQDGVFVLRFEDDTDIQNGPDLHVWVLPDADYDGGSPDGYIDLGKIKGNVGGQNYELPDEFDPSVHRSVLVWCLRFSVPFAAAPLT